MGWFIILQMRILVTVGVSEGVDLAMRTMIDPGDEVISPDPGYVAYEADIILAGGVSVPVPTYAQYNFGVRAAEIAAAITPAYQDDLDWQSKQSDWCGRVS